MGRQEGPEAGEGGGQLSSIEVGIMCREKEGGQGHVGGIKEQIHGCMGLSVFPLDSTLEQRML